jgi:hypothetical protein
MVCVDILAKFRLTHGGNILKNLIGIRPGTDYLNQGVTKRCRLSLLTIALLYTRSNAGGWEGGLRGLSK